MADGSSQMAAATLPRLPAPLQRRLGASHFTFGDSGLGSATAQHTWHTSFVDIASLTAAQHAAMAEPLRIAFTYYALQRSVVLYDFSGVLQLAPMLLHHTLKHCG